MIFSIPATENLKKYIGKTYNQEEIKEIVKKENGIDSLILKKAEKYEEVLFQEESLVLQHSVLIIIGTKNKGLGVIINPENLTKKDCELLSIERAKRRDLTYVDSEELANILMKA